ncbi:MAG: hypothetical protein Q8P67_13960, partial [archaeon]|nr:hypothetical protein [archaeon]
MAPSRKKIPRHGDGSSMNLPDNLLLPLKKHSYFRGLFALKAFHPVLHEMEKGLTSITVSEIGNSMAPSKALMLLFKLHTLKLTENQVTNLIRHPSQPL